MKKKQLTAVILCGLAAAVWTVRAILGAAYEEYSISVFWFAMSILCAIIWIAVFIIRLKALLSSPEEQERY